MSTDSLTALRRRLAAPQPAGWLDVRTKLKHFALINYALPKSRLERYLPADRFEIPEFEVGGQRLALMSAVPFVDADFHFIRLFPFLKFSFGQTNYRVYVIDRATGEHAVWFFGTTLGSGVVHLARSAWGIPWHPARCAIDCRFDPSARRYAAYRYRVQSRWGAARIDLEDTGEPVETVEGFAVRADWQLVLTHPLEGYYYRADGRPGTYSVWHDLIPVTRGRPRDLYFGLYERLGLLSSEEMQRPHSIFLCPETEFRVCLPPRALAPRVRAP